MDYGSPFYMTAKQSLLTTLDVIHNTGLRMAIGAFRSNPINSILNITGEEPLNNRRNQLMLQFAIRTATDQNKQTYFTIFDTRFENTFNNNTKLTKSMYKRIREIQRELNLEIKT